jgi:hypothetical protein
MKRKVKLEAALLVAAGTIPITMALEYGTYGN